MTDLLVKVWTGDFNVSLVDAIPTVKIIETAMLGPTGPQGPPGDPAVAAHGFGEIALLASRVVKFTDATHINYANNDDLGDRRLAVALTIEAGGIGDAVDLILRGPYTDGAWSWTPGESVYLDVDGFLTQTVPTKPPAQFIRVVGVAIAADSIFFEPETPITLA